MRKQLIIIFTLILMSISYAWGENANTIKYIQIKGFCARQNCDYEDTELRQCLVEEKGICPKCGRGGFVLGKTLPVTLPIEDDKGKLLDTTAQKSVASQNQVTHAKDADLIGCVCPKCHHVGNSSSMFSNDNVECPECQTPFSIAEGRAMYEHFRNKTDGNSLTRKIISVENNPYVGNSPEENRQRIRELEQKIEKRIQQQNMVQATSNALQGIGDMFLERSRRIQEQQLNQQHKKSYIYPQGSNKYSPDALVVEEE